MLLAYANDVLRDTRVSFIPCIVLAQVSRQIEIEKGLLMRSRNVLQIGIILLLVLTLGVPIIIAQDAEEQVVHTVQPGDNLYRISLRYGVTMDDLASANEIVDRTRIFVGQNLIIPGLDVPTTSEVVENPLVAGTPITYVVEPGDNLRIIANKFEISVETILEANNIANPNLIYRGQELQIWSNTPTEAADLPAEAAAPVAQTIHIVQSGEILTAIAEKYGVMWQDIAAANNLPNINRVLAGQELIIPGVSAATTVDTDDLGILTGPAMVIAPEPTITVGKQIVVDLSDSMTYAYENGQLVYSTLVSTGTAVTPTVQGDFKIYSRYPSQTMSGPGYYLPGVEHVQYFFRGYAIHGTYWHDNFGTPMSHGCVNMTNADAEWFYNFADIGTSVRVQY